MINQFCMRTNEQYEISEAGNVMIHDTKICDAELSKWLNANSLKALIACLIGANCSVS